MSPTVNYGVVVPYYAVLSAARGGVVVEALRYKLAGSGFDSRLSFEFSSDIILPVALLLNL